ncbi:MAG: NAD-dependent epimerase/dehydratase family protein [Candidatus Obscuribacterales bacterium]
MAFIGKHVVAACSNWVLRYKPVSNWACMQGDHNLHLLECDLSNFQSTKELMAQSRADIILHLAATVTAQGASNWSSRL